MRIRTIARADVIEEIEMHVEGILAGRRLESVALTGKDFNRLSAMKPEELRHWVDHLSTRFHPEG